MSVISAITVALDDLYAHFHSLNLRSDLHNLVASSNEWQMLFNMEKCKLMHLGYNNPKADYVMDGSVLQSVGEEKDLRVIVSDDSKWEKQCSEAVKKANRILGMIKRNFTDRLQSALIPLYKSLVRPHLEYCCSVWNPYFRKYIELVEAV